MHKSDFYYDLPPELIAQQPLPERRAGRLLILDGADQRLQDSRFEFITDWLEPNDLLVFNDTKVIPARLYGQKPSGGQVEVLIERVLEPQRALAHIRASRAPKPGSELLLERGVSITVEAREGELFVLKFNTGQSVLEVLDGIGRIPLPPYIKRPDEATDQQRYQTVFARHPGAVAAPTAGLHFDQSILDRMAGKGIKRVFVTLHVGAGTFQPVRSERVQEHRMHSEWLSVSQAVCDAIQVTRECGGRVVAVGTTVVRSLGNGVFEGAIAAF